jgi:transcriptional regulator with XRE-family HTH domain
VKNPVRIAKRILQNPHTEIGGKLRDHRLNAEMTQWELASAIADILDTKRLLLLHLKRRSQNEAATFVDSTDLDFVQQQFQALIGICSQVKTVLACSQQEWVNEAITQLLNVEQQVGDQIEAARRKQGLTQDQLSAAIDKVLELVGMSGPPNRAGISKVERGERRVDLLEGCAAAIALKIELEELLPAGLAALLPQKHDLMRGWHPFTIWDNCRQYEHDRNEGILTIVCEPGLEIPLRAIALAGA